MKKLIFSLLAVLAGFHSFAQKKDQVLLTVAGDNIAKSEFEKIYRKNNTKENSLDKRSVQDYLDLYINYKLKVKEAEELKLDTSRAFVEELTGYRKQLAQPYLTDKVVSENLVKEAYERMKSDIRASHILIRVAPDALPKDTLEAYNKALKIRETVLKKDFGPVAVESSEDPSAKENKGDLGYFTALQMVYPFETAAFNSKVGEVTMPVRTRFGYHIIKVTDRRPAQGEIHTAHIMVKAPAGMSSEDSVKAKAKIDEILEKLKKGENFEDLARQYSDDAGSGRNGGVLPWFGTGRMVPEFEKAAFSLQTDGEVSAPIKTQYGWHIIKRLEKKGLPSFEAMQNELKTKVGKDSRSEISKFSLIKQVKKEYGFKEYLKARDEVIALLDTSIFEGKWDVSKAKNLSKPVFKLEDKQYTQQDFVKYIADHQGKRRGATPEVIGRALYDQFVNEICVAYEEQKLDSKYPEFRSLMQEYRDGILLFDLTDRKVWSKAVKDTAGLKEFYNRNKERYMWPERLEAVIYACADAGIAEKVRELLKKGISSDSMLSVVNQTSQLNLSLKEGKFALGDNEIIDSIKWEKGLTGNMKKQNSIVFVQVKNKLSPEPKTLEEAKGLVTAEYQAHLEKEWIASLRKKYPVVVYNEVLKNVAQ
jgi:peptidyl-prolyl cis-trans isomerase SurA